MRGHLLVTVRKQRYILCVSRDVLKRLIDPYGMRIRRADCEEPCVCSVDRLRCPVRGGLSTFATTGFPLL